MPLFEPCIGERGIQLEAYTGKKDDTNVMVTNQNAPGIIRVNVANPLFSPKNEEEFALLIGALPHEMQHTKQFRDLMNNRGFGKDSDEAGGKEKVLSIPSIGAINMYGFVKFPQAPYAYIAQPLELQGHLLQKAAQQAILRQLQTPGNKR